MRSIRLRLLFRLAFAAALGAMGTLPLKAAPANQTAVQAPRGWYLTLGAGAVWPPDVRYHTTTDPDNYGKFNLNSGFSADGGVGYDFGQIRTELTYGYSAPSLDSIHSSSFGESYDTSGNINKNDIFFNAYWDVWRFGRFTPYLGAGLGYTNLTTPSETIAGYPIPSATYGGLGWQAKVGVSYAVSYNWDLYAEGTYSGIKAFSDNNIYICPYSDYGAKLGVRYRFGHPAVVVVPVPPVEPPVKPPVKIIIIKEKPIRALW